MNADQLCFAASCWITSIVFYFLSPFMIIDEGSEIICHGSVIVLGILASVFVVLGLRK